MREGDFYPHLRNVKIERYTMVTNEGFGRPIDWLNEPATYAVRTRDLPAYRITIPAHDWEAIMEIYQAHFHPQVNNPGVIQAWEQYKMMVTLARP